MRKFLAVAALASLLAACGDKQTASIPASWSPTNNLTYAYPYNGQTQIAPSAPVVLHFASALKAVDPSASFQLHVAGGASVPFDLITVDDRHGVVIQPESDLRENTSYEISWSNLASTDGNIKPVPITFTTRPANKGARSLMVGGSNPAAFTLLRSLPVQSSFPLMDFSSLRLQFNQPIDQKTLKYGSAGSATFSLVDSSNALVPARILVSNRLLTIDPVDDLLPGQQYTLTLGSGIKSTLGDALTAASQNFTPLNSKPRATMVLQAPPADDDIPSTTPAPIKSILTGADINNVPIVSTLLGKESASQQSGDLYAELAFVPNYPKTTPLRVPRGNVLKGASVKVQIAGKVPAGLNTGDIRVDIISDANGYMTDNPYSTAIDAPRQVYLTMDVSMSAANAAPNGAFNQNILHVDVVGTAIVKDGKLVMDAVGVVELDVLGLDQASGVLSFHLEGYQDQPNAPAQPVDSTPPSLQSWVPGDADVERARPGDPVILTFTEPLDPATITSASLQFLKGGVAEPFTWRADGSSIVLQPQTPLAHNASYTVQFTTELRDIAGNALLPPHSKTFSLPALATPGSHSPIALTTYPGFPCATTGLNIAGNVQGRCVGGPASDELMPLPTLPADRSIQVVFSQTMNTASIVAGGSFKAEAQSGASWVPVAGRLEIRPRSLSFTPDTPWTAGAVYRYTLGSNGDHRSATAVCNGTDAICGSNNLPLQTQAISTTVATAPTATGGGADLVIVFKGAAVSPTVFQSLKSLPTSDVNADFVHGAGEYGPSDNAGVLQADNAARIMPDPARTPYAGAVNGINIGCDIGQACPEKQFLYLTSALDAEVGDYDAALGGVKVLIQPTLMVGSSVDVYASASIGTVYKPAPTGPQVMRLRYALSDPANAGSPRNQPITGVIKETPDGPILEATLDAFLDAPTLDPVVNFLIDIHIAHNLRSYPLTIKVSGPVSFRPDGRMLARLTNIASIPINVHVVAAGVLTGDMFLVIPQGSLLMEGVSGPIKQ